MIPVTKPYFPNRRKLNEYLDGIYERQWLTNNGYLVQELTRRLEEYLGVENLLLVANGTLALQIAYRALGASHAGRDQLPEAVTTPFTFVATASALKWDGVEPVFVDIDPDTWCLDPASIEAAITPNTRSIVPVHVFGNACDFESIDEIARRHNLKVIYDASHAFGVRYQDKSLLMQGDAATLSFHATKIFHTAEGGAIVFRREKDLQRAKKMINFGIMGPDTVEELGINAKMNEIQAAMGLAVLDEISINFEKRSAIWHRYRDNFKTFSRIKLQRKRRDISENYAYFPVLLKSEARVVRTINDLKSRNVHARRYFYPSLNTLSSFDSSRPCDTSVSIAKRILCLPIYAGLRLKDVDDISRTVLSLN